MADIDKTLTAEGQRPGVFTVNGHELGDLLAHIRDHGGFVEMLERGKTNAAWRLRVRWPSRPETFHYGQV
jgi:hypothetical protein